MAGRSDKTKMGFQKPKKTQKSGEKTPPAGSIGGGSLFQVIENKNEKFVFLTLILLILLFILLLSVQGRLTKRQPAAQSAPNNIGKSKRQRSKKTKAKNAKAGHDKKNRKAKPKQQKNIIKAYPVSKIV
ncbi:MAG: hypothetical protein ACOYMG_19530 [Candidatus Methylumidiphilus sp.]